MGELRLTSGRWELTADNTDLGRGPRPQRKLGPFHIQTSIQIHPCIIIVIIIIASSSSASFPYGSHCLSLHFSDKGMGFSDNNFSLSRRNCTETLNGC